MSNGRHKNRGPGRPTENQSQEQAQPEQRQQEPDNAPEPSAKLAIAPEPHPECPTAELRLVSTQLHQLLIDVDHGVTLDDVMRPSYWKNVWRQLGKARNTEITAICVDGTWEALLRVTSVGEGYAKVRVLRSWSGEQKAGKVELPDGWDVDYVSDGWRVRNKLGEPIVSKLSLREDAIAAALAYIQKVSA